MSQLTGMITTEERHMVRDYLLLMHAHSVIQKGVTDLKFMDNVLSKAYNMCGRYLEDKILRDIKTLRLELKRQGYK